MTDTPLYTSKRMARNLWQEYRIYHDHLELSSWCLFHTIVVPANAIQAIEIRPSVFGGWSGMTMGIKNDLCDLFPHVQLTRKKGLFKRIGITPDDPEKFVTFCESILRQRRSVLGFH
jgi:hypothetical protein